MTANKAIAGALVSVLVALLAKHGVIINQDVSDAINVIVAAAIGFVGVYMAPRNKPQ